MDAELEKTSLAPADRGLAQELAYGCVRWRATLDWLISRKASARQRPAIHALLQLGLYQMFWLDRIPDHAAVHETVQLARDCGFAAQSGFVNAVLRGYARERAGTLRLLHELRKNQPALGWSHPVWLVARWTQRWGPEKTVALMSWNNRPAPTFARLNAIRTDAPSLLEVWHTENVECQAGRWDWVHDNTMFELKSHPPLAKLRSFAQGLFYVQDPSTLLAVKVLDPQPGENVLDLCAAPGGKTTCIAERLASNGRVVACDVSMARIARLRSNCDRLGATCVMCCQNPPDQLFDRVLVDAPCSNTGVLRRRVDLRWRLSPDDLPKLQKTQISLLNRAARFVRPAGTLVYSTCSLEPEENSDVVKRFMAQAPGFELMAERQLLPFNEGVDGAYVARLTRSADNKPREPVA